MKNDEEEILGGRVVEILVEIVDFDGESPVRRLTKRENWLIG